MSNTYEMTGIEAYTPPDVVASEPYDPKYIDSGDVNSGGGGSGGTSLGTWLSNIWNDFTGVTAANIQAQAASDASATETAATQAAIDEQKRQFDAMQALMSPWVTQGTDALSQLGQYEAAGSDALSRQRALMGLDGPDAQRAAIEAISSGSEMAGLVGQGEDALRQQGSATGGLRGGNIQGALAQFRPQMLSSLINQQYSKLGGLIDMGQGITMNRATLGQASSSGMAAGGMQHASSLGDLLMRQGSTVAGGQLAAGQAAANASNLQWQPVRDATQMATALGLRAAGVF
jgi:hypothetical protein